MIQLINVSTAELVNLITEKVKEQFHEVINVPNEKNNQINDSEFLTRKETAKLFNVSLATLHDWNNNKTIKPYKMGNRTYYKRSELLETLFNSNRH
jgi:hypothetical protein